MLPLVAGLVVISGSLPAQLTPPVLSSISPSSAVVRTPLNITLNGSNFINGAYLNWNGQTVPVFVHSSTLATASISNTLLNSAGILVVFLVNPGGIQSNGLTFTVTGTPISIATTTLPAGAETVAYSATLTATGGSAPYIWTVTSAMPPGLTLQTDGRITGTPTAAGNYSISVRVQDASQTFATANLSLTIGAPPLSITNAALPAATVGQAYTATLSASGGLAPYRWAVTQLPAGLRLDAQGVFSGTPVAAGTFRFTVQVADSAQRTATKEFALTISPPRLAITTVAPLFTGIVGAAYAQPFSASGGVPPYRWTTVPENPGGLTLDSTGILQGTPQNPGTFSFTLELSDSAGTRVAESYSITINRPGLTITTAAALPAGTAGTPYTAKFVVTGGTPPYTWSVASGAIAGLALDNSGALTGIPTAAGTFTLVVEARDSGGVSASRGFNIQINAAGLSITSSRQLAAGALGQGLSANMLATGGVPPYTWSANGLPDGLAIDAPTGVISGYPAAAGNFSFTVRVTDSVKATAVDLFRLSIALPQLPQFSIDRLPRVVDPAQQLNFQVAMDRTFPVAVTGQAILGFSPDAGPGDGTVVFANGGRVAQFEIPAGETGAVFASPAALQTGTVAGNITVSLRLAAAGLDVTPSEPPSAVMRVERGSPVIKSVRLARKADGFDVEVSGFCTAREVTQMTFRFTAASGQTLQTSEITLPVESLFGTWFQDAAAAKYGSQFTVVEPFKVQGDANAVNLQSVTLTNRSGSASSGITP